MSTITPPSPTVRAAFEELIDYAGLFPPAKLPMADAAAEYAAARAGSAAWMLGRFVVPASRLSELVGSRQAHAGSEALPVSVIVDASLEPRRWFGSVQTVLSEVVQVQTDSPVVRIEALEIPLAPLLTARETFDASVGQLGALIERAGLRSLPAYVELPPGAHRPDALAGAMTALARARLHAKLRCGGTVAQAFPSVDAVAEFVAAAAEARVAFKATAGLHHPIRHLDLASGFTMHGFFNVLAAAAFAGRVAPGVLAEIVAEEDPHAFTFDRTSLTWRTERASLDDIVAMRRAGFVGYGSCSFDEPVDDLTALGLLPAAA